MKLASRRRISDRSGEETGFDIDADWGYDDSPLAVLILVSALLAAIFYLTGFGVVDSLGTRLRILLPAAVVFCWLFALTPVRLHESAAGEMATCSQIETGDRPPKRRLLVLLWMALSISIVLFFELDCIPLDTPQRMFICSSFLFLGSQLLTSVRARRGRAKEEDAHTGPYG